MIFMEKRNSTVLCAVLQAISCPALTGFTKCREDSRVRAQWGGLILFFAIDSENSFESGFVHRLQPPLVLKIWPPS